MAGLPEKHSGARRGHPGTLFLAQSRRQGQALAARGGRQGRAGGRTPARPQGQPAADGGGGRERRSTREASGKAGPDRPHGHRLRPPRRQAAPPRPRTGGAPDAGREGRPVSFIAGRNQLCCRRARTAVQTRAGWEGRLGALCPSPHGAGGGGAGENHCQRPLRTNAGAGGAWRASFPPALSRHKRQNCSTA